jgi:transposase
MNAPNDEHRCAWRERAEALEADVKDLNARIEAMERRIFGKKSERMKSKERELREGEASKRNGPEAQEKRRTNEKRRARIPSRTILHPVAASDCACPACGGVAEREVGSGRQSTIYEYIPGRFEQQIHVQQTLACRCGEYVVTAPPPAKVVEKGQYGPGLVAHVVVARTLDSIPFHRQQKQFERLDIPVNESTLCGLYHRAADLLRPIYPCIVERVAEERVAQADETPLKMHGRGDGKSRPGFMWTFALGRKNWQLVGHEDAGQNTAILHTLVANCVLKGINPHADLADVLIRVQTHPASGVADLMPSRWAPLEVATVA